MLLVFVRNRYGHGNVQINITAKTRNIIKHRNLVNIYNLIFFAKLTAYIGL